MTKSLSVKCPWFLKIGMNSWIGEDVWIDNFALVEIGSNTCISQGAYFCTGNHDWRKPNFPISVKPIKIGDSCWVAAKSILCPGSILKSGSIICIGSVWSGESEEGMIYFTKSERNKKLRSSNV
jgi:putative colanic acid biosynthesis acetyltransferase WcaF